MFARSLPNIFTIANLFLGIVSIIFVFNNESEIAAMLVIVAMLTDGLDGRVARALNVTSEFGKELDSLSDVISFGVAPAFIVYSVAFQDFNSPAAWIATAIFPICGALRLARFNVISGVPGYFIGLPIPAAGGVLATMALFYKELSTPMLLIAELILSFLMVSNIKYPNFKKVRIPRSAMWIIPVLVIIAILVAIKYPGTLSKLMFIPFVIYALLGLKKNVRRVTRKRNRPESKKKSKVHDTL
ncbi:MAG: CDP-diacylglycerol--serine O-phosphatidyltransferase [Paenibacillaceae bacterium]